MATANPRYASRMYVSSIGGDRFEVAYRVTPAMATNEWEACKAPGVPQLHEQLTINGLMLPLYAHQIEARPASDGVEKYFTVRVVFEPPSTKLLWVGQVPLVRWSVGQQSIRSLFSKTGVQIGSNYLADDDGRYTTKDPDPEAEFGTDELVTTCDFSVRCVPGTAWNPVLVTQLANRTNWLGMMVQNVYFPPGSILFQGGDAEPVGPGAMNYIVTYRYMAGMKAIPQEIPAFYEDTNTTFAWPFGYPTRSIGIAWDVWPRYNGQYQGDFGAFTLRNRKVVGVSVYQKYYAADLSVLRWTP